jgi:hypothetical protein
MLKDKHVVQQRIDALYRVPWSLSIRTILGMTAALFAAIAQRHGVDLARDDKD